MQGLVLEVAKSYFFLAFVFALALVLRPTRFFGFALAVVAFLVLRFLVVLLFFAFAMTCFLQLLTICKFNIIIQKSIELLG